MRVQCLARMSIGPLSPFAVATAACAGGDDASLYDASSPSGLHELHLRAGQLQQVAVLQRHGFGADGGAVKGGLVAALDVRHNETVWGAW